MDEDFERLIRNPHLKVFGFGGLALFVRNWDAPLSYYQKLWAMGIAITPSLFVYNYRYEVVKYLLDIDRLDPNLYLLDLCVHSTDSGLPIIQLLMSSDKTDLRATNVNGWGIRECLLSNRLFHNRGFINDLIKNYNIY